jgi:hypothetical protein
MTFDYDSSNVKDNETRKFQPDGLGEVAINIRSNDFGSWAFKAVGNKIIKIDISSTVEEYSFQKDSVELMRIRVIYQNLSKNDFVSVERIV